MRIRKLFVTFITVITICVALTVGATAAETPSAAYNGYIVKLNPSSRHSALSTLDLSLDSVPYLDNLYLTDDLELGQELVDRGIAEYVEPNYILEPLDGGSTEIPNDPKFLDQWTLDAINYLSLYSKGHNGKNVTVAIIDSGLYSWYENSDYYGHEEFEDIKISSFSKNFLGPVDKGEQAPYYYRDQTKVGHGSFVASQIAAATNNGKGIAGISDGVELMILRCISAEGSELFPYENLYDSNSGSISNVAAAIQYAADHGADVINISLGASGIGSTSITTLQDAVNYANDRGVIIVAAAGNSNSSSLVYPAACENVIGVGSVSKKNGTNDEFVRSPFSQMNNSVIVTAPGDLVLGVSVYPSSNGKVYTSPEDSYITGIGTSYSSPVVAAMAAIVKSINSELDYDDFKSLLAVTSKDHGLSGWDTSYGYGILDASAMLEALTVIEHPIEYDLADKIGPTAKLPDGHLQSYILGRTESLTLPTPTRVGYSFEGWYETANYSGEPISVLPLGAMGLAKSSTDNGVVSYYIDKLTFYAKWSEIPVIESVTVLNIPAQVTIDNNFTVKLPNSAISDLSKLENDNNKDIIVTTSLTTEISIVKENEDGSFWNIVLGSNPSTTYTLSIEISEYDIPTVVGDSSIQSGTALLPSLCGLVPMEPYIEEVSTWFTEAETYIVVSSDGKGDAKITGSTLTYTPKIGLDGLDGDYSGQLVTIVLKASNPDFESEGSITVKITIGRSSSSSDISPSSISYDLYTDLAGIDVNITLYDNTLNGLYIDGNQLSSDNYILSAPNNGGSDLFDSIILTLKHTFLSSLPLGESQITFKFSAGSDRNLTIILSDSTQKYTVSFYTGDSDAELFHTISDIRNGSKLALPAEPKKDGHFFTGWYLSDGTTRITENTVVTSSFSVYAKWSKETGGGGPPGGGGPIGGGGSPPEETEPENVVLAVGGTLSSELSITVSEDSATVTIGALTDSEVQTLALAAASVGKPLSIDLSSLDDKVETAIIPSSILSGLDDAGTKGLEIIMPGGNAVGFDSAALATLRSAGSGDLSLSVKKLHPDELSEDQKGLVGKAPVIDLSAYVGKKQVHNFGGGFATISIPVIGIPSDHAIIWRMTRDADGKVNLEAIECTYNAATKCYEFQTGSFSEYVVGIYPFSDTPDSSWYYEDTVYAYVNELFKGTSDTTFSPAVAMTRGMVVTVLWRMEGSPKPNQSAEFSDVGSSDWYTDAISWAVANEIVSGYGQGKFGPNDNITREQLVTILHRYAEHKKYRVPSADESLLASFKDVENISSYAITAMSWAHETGLIQGTNGNLLPRGDASRAQVAAILRRFTEGGIK